MDCFNNLLLKLREVHEREVEGWQMKIQELSNKKGCETKRMEELFTKNQQMKEQQKLLTENIKTLENRLRAGLCDRCTVTQEVAKRRQQEFDASQLQSLQHLSLMAGEMNNLKKENKRLRDELKLIKAALQGHNDRPSNNSATTEVQSNSSPDLSPSCKPVPLISMATSTANNQPADGDVVVKTESDQRSEHTEHRPWSSMNRGHYDLYKPLSTLASSSPWKTEHNGTRVGERRSQTFEGLDHQPSIPPQALLLMTSPSSASGEVNLSRHVVHAPVPCRPQPVKSSPVALPWQSSPAANLVLQPSPKPNQLRFPNLITAGQHCGPRRQNFGSVWHKQSSPKLNATEPTVLFRLRGLSEHVENQTNSQEKPEITPSKAERISGEGLREVYDGPLDLSDRGKSNSSQSPKDYSNLALKGAEGVQNSHEKDLKTNPSAHGPSSSPHCVKEQEEEDQDPNSDLKHKANNEQEEEVNGKTDQSSEKKVPVLTISLRPVVLETLNSALQKQESISSNEKSLPSAEALSSGEEQDKRDHMSGQDNNQSYKRKRTFEQEETDRETDNIQDRKIKITMRTEENSPSLH
ncbi:RBBP8 N-terminal-like protein isoform X2 [Antennarius striatus]|uniref:RBBP8 N-terminal-like protein isoform X2 n=1 Tax=Antennarius striatus TaxID=241820 RepID=UPI0035B39F50